MNKQQLISTIEAERDKLEEAVAALSPGQVTEPNLIGTWSVKDVLAHLAVWCSRCVTAIFNAEQGQKPEDIDAMFDQYDTLNAEDYQTQKDRVLDQVLADYRGVHRQLVRRLNDWKEADLFDKRRFPWLRGQSIADFVVSEVPGHEAEHRGQIEQLRK
jgi:hypothetical protein